MRLTHWPIDILQRKRPELRRDPLVLIRSIASRPCVAHLCPQAAARGVRPAMTLAQARALCPRLQHAPHQPRHDQRQLLTLSRWLMRFTPVVSPAPPDAIFLDCTGCQRLYGSLLALRDQVAAALAALRIRARLAIAPTVGAAWAIASYTNTPIVTSDALLNALCPLPPAALRLDPDSAALLQQLGIETIGQLIKLARPTLPARFGPDPLHRLDAALGRIHEPLVPLPHHGPIATSIHFDGPIDSLQTIQEVMRKLVARLIAQLARRGCGARLLRVQLYRMRHPPIVKMIRLACPTRSLSVLFNLLRCVLDCPLPLCWETDAQSEGGLIAIRLRAAAFEPLPDAQGSLLDQQDQAAGDEWARLVEMLAARLGPRSLCQPQLVQSHLPEKAYRHVEPTIAPDSGASASALPLRPLRLLPQPAPVLAVACPSDDDSALPLSFTHLGQVHAIRYADGPERIAGLWWEGRDKTRDYFDVEDQTGQRFWLFRVTQTGQWYLHGLFD